jgi:lysophospholipase L1-like esterase
MNLEITSSGQPKPTSGHRLSRGRQLVFVALIILTIGVFQEFCFRGMFPIPEAASFNRINYSPIRTFDGMATQWSQGVSNVKFRWESAPDGFAFDHTLNLYGFRGQNFSIQPQSGCPRVMFVGDSFAEGCGAADEETIPRQFARILEQSNPVEAINLGVKGTGFPEYLHILRDGVYLLHPRDVFLVACWNDLPATPIEDEKASEVPRFAASNPFLPRVVEVISRLRAGLVVPRRYPSGPYPYVQPVPSPANPMTFLRNPPLHVDPEIVAAMRQGRLNPALLDINTAYEKHLRVDLGKTGGAAEYLKRMKEYCRRQEARLIVVYIPFHITTNPMYAAAQNRLGGLQYDARKTFTNPIYRQQQSHLAEVTRGLQIPFLDTTGEFLRAEKNGNRLFWPVDGHCNAAGYHLVAEICARYWIRGELPRPADTNARTKAKEEPVTRLVPCSSILQNVL